MIQVSPFLGELPKISDRLIPDQHAATAENCDLESASLRPAPGASSVVQLTSSTRSVFRHPKGGSGAGTWFRWSKPNINMVRSPLNDDAWERVYWTGDNAPKMAPFSEAAGTTPPSISYRLGIPAPTGNIGAGAPTETLPDGAIEVDAVYAVTFVSAYGEEGPPSPPSQMVTRFDGGTVTLSNLPAIPAGAHNITTKRIYRAETGGTYLYVADVAASEASFADNIPTENLGLPLPSMDWDMPDGRMIGLLSIGNGILAGWFENTLCFCEAYRPHAWPVGYQLGFESDIVGIAPVSGGLIVVTQQAPWLVTGASPAAMVMSKLDVHLGGVSRRSVVDMGEYAIYASSEGLVAVGGGQAQVITQSLLTRQQWLDYNPASIHAYRWHDRYLAFFTRANGTKGALLMHPEQGLIHYPATNIESGWFDQSNGSIYLITSSGAVQAWWQGSSQPYTWKSKVFTLPARATMPVAKVDGLQDATSPINLTIWADGQILHQQPITDSLMIRLPSGRYRNWQFQLTGTAEVFSVQIAPSPAFLR